MKKIAHFSDFHIHNLQRHDEYRLNLPKIYQDLIKIKPDRIVISGDLFVNYIEITNEAKALAGEFLNKLAEIAKVIITVGNHDIMKKNKTRLNSVLTIVNLLNNPNIVYLGKTDFYNDDDIVWVNYSHLEKNIDPWTDIPHTKDFSKTYIGLFHDPIAGSVAANGQVFSDKSYHPVSYFDNCDFVMLGDIHKRQFFRENGSIAYPSSTFQQTFDEEVVRHGFLLWNIEDRDNFTVEEHDIHNDYNLVTFKIEQDTNYQNLQLKSIYLTPNSKVKIKWCDIRSEVNHQNEMLIRKYFKDNYGYTDIIIEKKTIYFAPTEVLTESIDVLNPNTQKEIFTEYLKLNNYDDNFIEEILKIDDLISDRLIISNEITYIEWSIDKIWFDNFKSYGDNNIIDWKNKNGIIQIHGINQQGKTTILDAICYILYGKTIATQKVEKNGSNRYINNKRKLDYCEGGIVININNTIYTIIRRTDRKWNRDKTEISSCSTNVDYYEGTELTEEYKLSGERKKQTQTLIDNAIGDFNDFIRLVLTTADNLNDLLSIDRSVFIDSVSRDAGYDIFEKKLAEFKLYRKEISSKRINFSMEKYQEDQSRLITEIEDFKLKNTYTDFKKSQINTDIKFRIEEKEKLIEQLQPVDETLENFNLMEITDQIRSEDESIKIKNNQLSKIESLKEEIKQYSEKQYSDKQNEFSLLNNEISTLVLNNKDFDIKKSNLNSNINTVNMDINNIINEYKHNLQKNIDNIELKISKLKEEFNSVIINYKSDLIDKINKLSLEKSEMKAEIEKIVEEGKGLKAKNQELEHSKTCITCHRPLEEGDLVFINKTIEDNKVLMLTLKNKFEELKPIYTKFDTDISELKTKLELLKNKDYSFDIELNKQYKNVLDDINNLKEEIEENKIKIENTKSGNVTSVLNEQLKPSYNIKNKYLEELGHIEEVQNKLKKEIDEKSSILNELEFEIKKLKTDEENFQKKKEIIQMEDKINLEIEKLRNSIEKKYIIIDQYKKESDKIESNREIKHRILEIQTFITDLNNELRNYDEEKMNISTSIRVNENALMKLDEDLVVFELQKKADELFDIYTKCVHRDGIPSFLLKKSIHIINEELSNLLTGVDFTVYFDENLDLKMSSITRLDVSQNAIESSGMERTFIATVLKLALRKVNNNSRPNFIMLDEIMGKLVENSVDLFITLIDNIKECVDKLVIIEHIHPVNYDYMIDVVKDEEGVSKLSFVE